MLNWYLQGGKESDVVVSSRIRFARNLSNFPFMTKLDKTAKQKIEETPDIFKAAPQFITQPKQEKELITDLVIINLPKTIRAIHNIKRVYTM